MLERATCRPPPRSPANGIRSSSQQALSAQCVVELGPWLASSQSQTLDERPVSAPFGRLLERAVWAGPAARLRVYSVFS